MVGNLLTSAIAGTVVLVTLLIVGVPYAPVWGLWVALVDFLPIVGGALAGIPTILFAFSHSVTAGIVTFVVFIVYTQVENHILNPLVMSRTVKISPLLVLLSVVIGYSIGSWIDGLFGGFVACLLAIPSAGAIQILGREAWRATAGHGKTMMAGIDQEAAGAGLRQANVTTTPAAVERAQLPGRGDVAGPLEHPRPPVCIAAKMVDCRDVTAGVLR